MSLNKVWAKIKSIKHIEIIAAVVVGLFVCLIYFSFFGKSSKDDKISQNSTAGYSTITEYVDMLENKLCNVLSKISGVGNVNVIITVQSGFTYEYATDTETKTSVSGSTETTITTQTVILVSGEPLISREIYPTIKGVVVVAEGAENIAVKLNILTAVETVLDVDENNITILA